MPLNSRVKNVRGNGCETVKEMNPRIRECEDEGFVFYKENIDFFKKP